MELLVSSLGSRVSDEVANKVPAVQDPRLFQTDASSRSLFGFNGPGQKAEIVLDTGASFCFTCNFDDMPAWSIRPVPPHRIRMGSGHVVARTWG